MIKKFTLQYWTDDGWFVGKIVEIPSVFSQGKTIIELIENIREVYQLLFFFEDETDISLNQNVSEMELIL